MADEDEKVIEMLKEATKVGENGGNKCQLAIIWTHIGTAILPPHLTTSFIR